MRRSVRQGRVTRCDGCAGELKQRMEDMAVEFGDMLKETLDKMSERIEATASDWDNDQTTSNVQKKLEDFNLGAALSWRPCPLA